MGFLRNLLLNLKKKNEKKSPPNPKLPSKKSIINEELTLVFNKLDIDGDGKISAGELASILGTTADEIEKMMKLVVGDGTINLNQFIEINAMDLDSVEFLESLQEAFLMFDADKNGFICAEELHNVLRILGEDEEDCSVFHCRKMIAAVDSDRDGQISFQEFKSMMTMGSRFNSIPKEINTETERKS